MWKNKTEYNQLFQKCHYIKDLNVERVMSEFKFQIGNNYSLAGHLVKKVKENQEKRRKKSIIVRHENKEIKILELMSLLEKFPDRKNDDFIEIMGISKQHFYRLKKEVIVRQKNIELELKLNSLKCDLNRFVEIREKIKFCSFENLNNWEKGMFTKTKKLFKNSLTYFNSNYNSNLFTLNLQMLPLETINNHIKFILNCNSNLFTLNLQKLLSTDIDKLKEEIDWETDNLDFDYDLSSDDFWKKSKNAIKRINQYYYQIFIKILFDLYK